MTVPKWDTDEGLRMWQAGCTAAEIAETLGCSVSAVKNWADKHWPRKYQAYGQHGDKVAWNEAKGLRLYQSGASWEEIGRAVDRSAEFVRLHAIRNWGAPDERKRIPTARECQRPCWYMSETAYGPICNYYLDTSIRRPCPCGPDCTVRIAKRRPPRLDSGEGAVRTGRPAKPRKPRAKWDTAKAVELRAQGWTHKRIAEALGTTEASVEAYLRAQRRKKEETNGSM